MKKTLTSALLILIGSLLLAGMLPNAAHAERTIGDLEFADNFNDAMETAQDSGKSMILKFYTDWCHWCKVMDDSTFPHPYVQEFLENFSLGMINAEEDTLVAQKFGVRSYPTTVLVNYKGEEIDRMVGYYPPEEFVTQILNAYAGIGTLDYYLAELRESSKSPELNYEVGQKYRWKGDYDKAGEYFRNVIVNDENNLTGFPAQASFNLGHMQYKLKNYLAAVEQWRRTVSQFGDDPIAVDAEIMIAYSYQQAEDYESARKEYNDFLEKYPDTEEREWIEKQFAEMDGTK